MPAGIRFVSLALLASTAACSGPQENTEEVQTEAAPVRGEIDGRTFEAVELDAMRPAFTEETVVKLNAIVRRSLEIANDYTGSIRSIRETVHAASAESANDQAKQEAQNALAILDEWHVRALTAQTDMEAAVNELQKSDEVYNDEILAGMRRYVDDVEQLIRTERETLQARFQPADKNNKGPG